MKKKIRRFSLIFAVGLISTVVVEAQTVMQKLKDHNNTTHFAEALQKAQLDTKLEQAGPFTLFAPSNKAFDNLTGSQKTNKQLLLNHIFTGMATERSLKAMSDITCLSGRTISIKGNEKKLSVDSFLIISSNIQAQNGVIHIIDGVIK